MAGHPSIQPSTAGTEKRKEKKESSSSSPCPLHPRRPPHKFVHPCRDWGRRLLQAQGERESWQGARLVGDQPAVQRCRGEASHPRSAGTGESEQGADRHSTRDGPDAHTHPASTDTPARQDTCAWTLDRPLFFWPPTSPPVRVQDALGLNLAAGSC